MIAAYSTRDLGQQREATLQRLNLKRGERVIDISCGPGFLCERMAVGIDISEDLIDFATKHKSGETIEYRVGNATALPIDAEQFDVAVSTQVIEYVADADAALCEIARVLRPGGFIVDTDFDSWVWHAADAERMARMMKGWEMHCADPRLPRTLIPRLRAAGFKIVGVEGYPIVNTTYRPGDFSFGLTRLIADFLVTRGFDRPVLDGWLADLSATEQRDSSFFSLNRYFFSIEKS